MVGWFFEQEVLQCRRVRLVERRRDEALEQRRRRGRVARGLERPPVRFGLHVPRDRVLQREREQVEHDDREQCERHRLRHPHAAAAARDPRDEERPGEREQRVPADVLPDVLRLEMPELVRDHDAQLPVGEPPVQQRVPEHDAPARAEARRLGVRQRRHVVDGLDDDRRVLHVLDALERARLRLQLRVVQAVGVEQVRSHERRQRDEPDEDRSGGQPPPPADEAAEPHHDQEREAEEHELAAEREPVAEGVRDVADVRQVMPALPPEAQESERQLRDPDEREADHPEQHPGADRPGRRLAREPRAAPRVEAEDDELGELGERPVDRREAPERGRRVQLGGREQPAHRDLRQPEARGHRRPPEEIRGHRPDRREGGDQRRARRGPRAHTE